MEDLKERAERLVESAEAASAENDWATAAAAWEEAADAFRTLGLDGDAAEALTHAGGTRFASDEFQQSIANYQAAFALAEELDLIELQAFALFGQSDGLARLRIWDEVEETTRRAIALMLSYGYEARLPATQFLLGKALYHLDQESDALHVLEQARQGYRSREAVAEVNRVDDFTIDVLLYLEQTDQAVSVASGCLGTSRALADPMAAAYAERRMGQALLAGGDAEIAIDHFLRARIAYRENGWAPSSASCDVWLARAYDQVGRTAESVELYEAASATFDAAGWEGALFGAQDELAGALLRLGRCEEAAEIDSQLTQTTAPDLDGQLDPTWQRIVIRLCDNLLRLEDDERAGVLLGQPAFDQTDPRVQALEAAHPVYGFWVATLRAWVDWRSGDALRGLQAALSLITRPEGPECDLAYGLALEMAGRGTQGPDKASILVRALAVLVRVKAWAYVAELATYVEGEAGFPAMPTQSALVFPREGGMA